MDFKKMTIAELRQYAKDKGIVGVSAMKKPELVDLLEKVELMTANKTAAQQQQDVTLEPKTEIKEANEKQPAKDADTNPSNLAVYDGQGYDPTQDSGQMAYGILEVMEGYGFIRSDKYLPGDKDI